MGGRSGGDEGRVGASRCDLRDAIGRHDGFVFATGGDGFAAAFARADDAVQCAAEVQRAVGRARLPTVRIGIHTGEAEERAANYFGPTVNRVARRCVPGSIEWFARSRE